MQVPLDPFVSLGLMTMACGGLGWLVGPSIGNQAFYLMNRRLKTQMMQKESEFFARVKKHRANPTNSSASNPGVFFLSASSLFLSVEFRHVSETTTRNITLNSHYFIRIPSH